MAINVQNNFTLIRIIAKMNVYSHPNIIPRESFRNKLYAL